jgi:nitrite reductase/ring-hydroxylating ferredoxin subunit
MPWTRVAAVNDCLPGTSLEVVAGDRIVAIFNVEGEFFALDGVCPHQGGPLGKGCLKGAVVTCPWHGWQFDVRTGQHQFSQPVKQPTVSVKVEEGQVFVDM